jgi:hypothetical protein
VERSIVEIQEYCRGLPAGSVSDVDSLADLLARCWLHLSGSSAENTKPEKLYGRMKNVRWDPPELTFVLERHGGTGMGSTRATFHHWTINVDDGSAVCNPNYGFRQVRRRDAPFHVAPLVTDIARLIVAGDSDPRLKWSHDRSEVRVLVSTFIGGPFQQTQQSRRKRFRVALEKALTSEGWVRLPDRRDVYRRSPGER